MRRGTCKGLAVAMGVFVALGCGGVGGGSPDPRDRKAKSEPPHAKPGPKPKPAPKDPDGLACDACGFLTDRDPAGTNVRAGPGTTYEVVDVLPTGGKGGVKVMVVGSASGWMEIHHAQADGEEILKRTGFVSGSLLGTHVKGGPNYGNRMVTLYAEASKSSEGVATVGGGVAKLEACDDGWLKVQVGGQRGWLALEDQCCEPLAPCK